MKYFILLIVCPLIALFSSCSTQTDPLKIAATPVPHADILNEIKPELAKEGIEIKVIEVDDYNLPNRLLAEKQVDANFFQHEPFLEMQKKQFGYSLVSLAKVHIEPLGAYSEKIRTLDALPDEAVIAIPNDPTNEARALKLLEKGGLITLKSDSQLVTTLDIETNPKRLKFEEIDAAFLPRALADVAVAIIPANFALQASLDPLKDAIFSESGESPYANLIAVRSEEASRTDFQKLKTALQSEKIRQFILDKYKGSILPAF